MNDVDVFRELQERYFGSDGKFEVATIKTLEALSSLKHTKTTPAHDIQVTELESWLEKVSCCTRTMKC